MAHLVVVDLFLGLLYPGHHGLNAILRIFEVLGSIVEVALHGGPSSNGLQTETLLPLQLSFEVRALPLEELSAFYGLARLFEGFITLLSALVAEDCLRTEHGREEFGIGANLVTFIS